MCSDLFTIEIFQINAIYLHISQHLLASICLVTSLVISLLLHQFVFVEISCSLNISTYWTGKRNIFAFFEFLPFKVSLAAKADLQRLLSHRTCSCVEYLCLYMLPSRYVSSFYSCWTVLLHSEYVTRHLNRNMFSVKILNLDVDYWYNNTRQYRIYTRCTKIWRLLITSNW